jgi:ribosome-associated heat shock protein Hsp15
MLKNEANAQTATAALRLDVWLWAARFYRTRSLAKTAIETGKVDVNGQRAKPSRLVKVDDRLQIVRGEETYAVTVATLASQRGAASVAITLYEEDEASRIARVAQRELRAAERSGYRAPEHKPDKRARRLIQALGDLDAL